jgi:corrinoid protein of di/trimethylamine methyltransferase
MTTDLLAQMAASLVDGDLDATVSLTQQALAAGLAPLDIVNGGLVPGMNTVGEKYSSGEFFLPNLIVAATAMKRAMALLQPVLASRAEQFQSAGTVVIGTVKGDIHEIGKSLVATMLEANGFRVHDLGVDVSADRFVETVRQTGANLVGLSALLTTTMSAQKGVIDALERAQLRGGVKVMVGGAPISQQWCDEIGADGFAEDAVGAVSLAGRLIGRA